MAYNHVVSHTNTLVLIVFINLFTLLDKDLESCRSMCDVDCVGTPQYLCV